MTSVHGPWRASPRAAPEGCLLGVVHTLPTRTQPSAPAQDVGEAAAPQLQAVGGPSWQRAAGGDGVAPALPAAQVSRRARAQQQALRVGLRGLLEEGAELPLAGVALAAGSRARLPVGLAKPATLAIKSAQHGELEAEIPICGESGTKSLVLCDLVPLP